MQSVLFTLSKSNLEKVSLFFTLMFFCQPHHNSSCDLLICYHTLWMQHLWYPCWSYRWISQFCFPLVQPSLQTVGWYIERKMVKNKISSNGPNTFLSHNISITRVMLIPCPVKKICFIFSLYFLIKIGYNIWCIEHFRRVFKETCN